MVQNEDINEKCPGSAPQVDRGCGLVVAVVFHIVAFGHFCIW